MKFFTCLIDPTGDSIGDQARAAYESFPRNRGLEVSWQSLRGVSTMASLSLADRPVVVDEEGLIAVGTVRLDNRAHLESLLTDRKHRRSSASDLHIVLQVVGEYGAASVSQILGDFAFVVWNCRLRSGVAACDAFAVKPLYYAERDGVIAFASRAEALALSGRYEIQYLMERVAYCNPMSPGLTVYEGVRCLPAATLAVIQREKLKVCRYWSADDFAPTRPGQIDREEAVREARRLLSEAVELRLDSAGGNWAQLSGGLDSSGVVSIAQSLFKSQRIPHGLDGTITYVDHPEVPDNDILFSREVALKWDVRSEYLVGIRRWRSREHVSPSTDYPDGHFSVFPREMHACELIRRRGGRVLLTGLGGDELFGGNRFYYADLLAGGQVQRLLRQLTSRAVAERRSFWRMAGRFAILPFLPRTVFDRLAARTDLMRFPPWYQPEVFRRSGVRHFGESPHTRQRHVGRMYHDEHVIRLESLIGRGGWQILGDCVDVRHPFLHRPLVEFVLRLPPEFSIEPQSSKPVLRAAIRHVLPETKGSLVDFEYARTGTGGSWEPDPRVVQSLTNDPMLADLGIVDAGKLRRAVNIRGFAPRHRDFMDAVIQQTLEVEAWLKHRSGRLCGVDESESVSQRESGAPAAITGPPILEAT